MIEELKSNCTQCFGLCCVALPFAKSADFPFDKKGGEPCKNLCSNHLCSIHDTLKDRGFNGCITYECFGAGQHVSQFLYEGRSWRENNECAEQMFSVFPIVQQLHEMLWYLKQALNTSEAVPIRSNLLEIYNKTAQLTSKAPEEILDLDVTAHRKLVNEHLVETSKLYRADFLHNTRKIKVADYIGANLDGKDLRGEDLRGKLMIAANLKHSDLRKVDFIGADLRDANLRGANLNEALFLTQSQINSAKGDAQTKIPEYLDKPIHWLS
ncbi:pentapeptide repeat-containing protein [Sediminibacillus massiliensis]|uniref:pentapeptide repeat-containing protein n=1 Tax=Sediminibacillus massiliensis TaxID=1926277 RepID=UPI0009886B7A|nr:pentapeptide repeat-containing protein [Sediminibacillus massiliensis]